MMIEFQMTSDMFRDLIHYRLQTSRPCIKDPLSFAGIQFYVDQVHINESTVALAKETQTISLNSLLENKQVGVEPTNAPEVERRPLRLSQKVVLDLVEASELINGGGQGTAKVIPRELLMVFDISVGVDSNGSPGFSVSLHDIPELAESLPPEEVAQIMQKMRVEVDRWEPFDLAATAAALNATLPPVINAGITVTSGANKLVVIRLDLEPKAANAKESWKKFFAGEITSRLFGTQWSLFMPEALIESITKERILESIKKQSKFSLSSGPAAVWAPEGNTPVLNVAMSGEIIDACANIDMDVDLQIRATMAVPKENLLRTTINLDWSGDTLEQVECLAAAAIVWPVVGGMLLSDDQLSVWKFIGGFFLPFPLMIIIGIVYLNSDEPMGEFDAEGWVKDSDSQRHQDQPFPDKVGFVEGLKLTSVFGVPEGAVLAGKLTLVQPLLPQLKIGKLEKFEWKVEDACNAPSAVCEPAAIGIIAKPMGIEPRVPLVICSMKVINDPKGFYEIKGWSKNVSKKEFVNSSSTLKIQVNPAAGAPTYDCQVLIVSNAGVRVVTVNAPSAGPKVSTPTLADGEKFHDWMKWKGVHCWLTHNIWVEMGLFNPEWHIDPGPFDYVQHWWVGLTGLNRGDLITLNESKLGALMSVQVGPEGTAELSAMIEQPRESTLMISRNGAQMDIASYKRRARAIKPPKEAPRSELNIRQVLMVRTGSISLRDDFKQMSLGYDKGRPTLNVVTGKGLNVYELESGIFPRRLRSYGLRGLLGAMQHQGELFTWGSDGLQAVTSGVNMGRAAGRCHETTATLDLAFKGEFAYALEPDGIRIYDWNLCPVGQVTTRGLSRYLAVTHDRLVIAGRDNLEFFDITSPTAPVRLGTLRLPGLEYIEPVQGPNARRKIYVHTSDGGVVLELTNAERPLEVAQYRGIRPWYSQSVRRGTFIARHDPKHRMINLYRIADSASGHQPRPRVTDIWPTRGR